MRRMETIVNEMGALLRGDTRLRLMLAVLLLGAPVIQAQTVMGSISGQVIMPPPPVGTGGPAANASVRICPYDGSSGTPCSPLAPNIYLDPAGTIVATSIVADQYGNYSFWVPQLIHGYIVQITPINGVTYSYSVMAVGGTVTSVAMTAPPIFAVSGSPVTSTGTLALSLVSQSANLVWASPVGSSGTPLFRSIVPADFASQNSNTVIGNCTGVAAPPTACPLTANMVPATLNATNFSGNVGITGTLSSSGAATLASLSVTGNGTVGGTLGVTGATTLSSTLGVTGAATLSSTLNVTGAVTLASTLASGAITSSGTVAGSNINTTSSYLVNGLLGSSGQCLVSNGTSSIYSGCPLFVVSQNGTAPVNPAKIVRFIAPLVAGTYTQTLSFGGAFPFGAIIYCFGNDLTAVNSVSVVAASSTSIVTTGTGSDQIQVMCIGG